MTVGCSIEDDDSDLAVTITTTITKSKGNTKNILKLNQNMENYTI